MNANSTAEEIKNALGNPSFNDYDLIYGYVGEDNYLFFDFTNKEVSVYPKVKVSEDDENKLKEIIEKMNTTYDIKTFASNLTDLWIDYDEYEYSSNYVDLKYTLKGVELRIVSNSLKNGIYISQNYSGNRNIQSLENVYIIDTDSVFEYEKSRRMSEILSINYDGNFSEEEEKYYLGTKFSIRFQGKLGTNETGNKGPVFYSRNREYPDSELDRNLLISYYIWYDDYNFVYSVDDDGIYVYNCVTRNNNKLLDVQGKITINSLKDSKIIYNETEELLVQIH